MMETTGSNLPAASVANEFAQAPLPGLTMGDIAVPARRKHEWPAGLFILLSYVTAGGMAIGAVTFGAFGVRYGLEPRSWVRVAGVGVWCVLQWRLAREVKRFSRWGWYGAMAELAGAALVKLGVAATYLFTLPSALVVLAVNGAWMRYFWNRRADYDVDLGG
ncbi:MAG TPA: hypothetical protein VGC13_25485 [Longimicrobium sp.]|jgi:hypothetical protein|uniref:hypothetical protein n=1 Tax=Longimicrobium sp. TaxID=2029185 RepID=UPI002EDB762A